MNNNGFYRAFEERYYAPRTVIKELRKQYLNFTKPLSTLDDIGKTFDIGCGRGEWLELMQEQGLTPYGVDLDHGMLQACAELKLPSHQGDAVAFLQTLDSESHVCITAFHVVEHVSFEQLQTIIQESLRILKPGGLLIMETPNPENIVVATRNFYLDPTHQRPIPPLLLHFLPEYFGFARVKTIRLQENPSLLSKKITLLNVLDGVSPDYAVIAQKKADDDISVLFDKAFNTDYGITLEMLVKHYEQAHQNEIQQSNNHIEKISNNINGLDERLNSLIAEIHDVKAEIQDIYLSKSWRLTYPLRWTAHQVRILRERGLKSRLKAVVKKVGKPIIQKAITLVKHRPKQRQRLIGISKKLGLHHKLKNIYHNINHAKNQPNQTPLEISSLRNNEYLSSSATKIKEQLISLIKEHRS